MVNSSADRLRPPVNSFHDWPVSLTDCLIGLLVPPVLIGAVGLKLMSASLTELGLGSEQLLQGQRLPTLRIHPDHPEPSTPA
ncbi:MAG TPA: hypothetical protein IGR64_14040 [Leptolyngbyaceae cyanobacterium M65_K2018_010]|nr:hypothetical protein [Leptolyngbyaceae cyanobacterium M65_K2018_010]